MENNQHSSGESLRAIKKFARFPLTLTLSTGEREQPLHALLKFALSRAEFSRRFAETLGAFLPLLGGEGRGEGERSTRFPVKKCSHKYTFPFPHRYKFILVLLLAPRWLPAQLPQQLPPGVAVQMMVPQPAVDVSPVAKFSTTAEFDPPTVRVGGKTFYRATVDATENSILWPDDISAPKELKFGPSVRGQITRMEGNKFHPLTAFVYEVTATATGHFTVPGFVVPAGWPPADIPAATLDVTENNSAPPIAAKRLLLEVSETNLFFGQPFRLRVLLPAETGNQIEALREVQFNGAGFMTDKLATRQSIESALRDGQPRSAFIYDTVATPMAAGALAISAQAFTAGREFGGPISINGQITIVGGLPKYILLTSEALKLNVRPLPSDGELAGFTGALGKFTADKPVLSTNQMRVGEPVHLKFGFLPGTNLTRFVPPEMPRAREWQIIADNLPGTGCTLIPLTDEAKTTPAIPFSAFDPETQNYYDLTIPALPVTVVGEALPVQLPAWNANDKNPAPEKLSGLATSPGKTVAHLKPLQTQGWFVCVQILPVIGFIALWRWDERRRFLEAHPEIVRRRKAKRDLQREKINIQAAVAANDAEKFTRHAAAAMRVAVAPHFPANERALVGGDVLAQLTETERSGGTGETVRKVFAAADAQFSGAKKMPVDLLALKSEVIRVLQQLEEKL